jgi:taurine dioxygenase
LSGLAFKNPARRNDKTTLRRKGYDHRFAEGEQRERNMANRQLVLRSITPNVGTEICGVNLGQLSGAEAETIRATLIDRKVIVLRDQDITTAQYAAFMQLFGDTVKEDLVVEEGNLPDVGVLHIQAQERQTINYWHMDHSFRDLPTRVLSLHAHRLPPCGGDTLFASLEAAYDGLSDELKQRIEGLHTLHKVTPTQNTKRRYTEQQVDAMQKAPPVTHPLVGFNSHNGRKFLFVNVPIYCRSIAEMQNPQGDALLRELYQHVQRPEFHFRLTWTPKTLVVWENVHCLHYPVADYFPHERKMWRVVIKATERPALA